MTAIAQAGNPLSFPLPCNTPVGVDLTDEVTLSPFESVVVNELIVAAVDSTDWVDCDERVIEEYKSLFDCEIDDNLAIEAEDTLDTEEITDCVALALARDAVLRLDMLL